MSKTCATCKYAPPMKKWPCEDCDMREPADRWEPKPKTNADRIRAMSDEKLAEWIAAFMDCGECRLNSTKCMASDGACVRQWLDWLKQEEDKPADTTIEGMIQRWEQEKAINVFDQREVHENCTVEIWSNSETGETSIGWWPNEGD